MELTELELTQAEANNISEFVPLAQLVDELRYTRQVAAEKRAKVKEIEKSIEDQLYAAKLEQAAMDKQVNDLEQAIRARGIEGYKRDGDKHPTPGVEIKLFDEATIEDPDKVRAFCFDNLPGALVVDEKKAKKYALDFDAVPGIKVERDVPRAQIATKL
jgi:hypothetical protein